MTENRQVTFGIVGCGMISHYHAQAIAATENAKLLGACSKSCASTERFRRKYGIRQFKSYEQLLACPEINAVSICSPSGDHAAQVLQALHARKDVVVEKPMCISLEEADEIIRSADRLGRKVCVISQLRFSDAIQEIKRAVDEKLLGRIFSTALTMRYYRTQAYYDQAAWRGTWSLDGGGILMNQGIHGVDMLCYLFGPAQSISGYAQTMGHDIEVEDTAACAIRFENGMLATIDASTCCPPGFPKKIVISGENGTIVMEEDAITLWTLHAPCRIPLGQATGSSAASDPRGVTCDNHIRQFANFADAILNDAPLVSDAREGRLPLEIILGAYQSARQGSVVTIRHYPG